MSRLARRVARIARRTRAVASPPPQFYQVSTGTVSTGCAPGVCQYVFSHGWLNSADLNKLYTQAAGQSSAPDIPRLLIKGHTKWEFANTTAVNMYVEACCYRSNETGSWPPATQQSAFSNSWSFSYDFRNTGFESFPSTSMRQNWAFFQPRLYGVIAPKFFRFKVRPGGIKTLIHRNRASSGWLDYQEINGTSSFVLARRSTSYIFRVRFATGVVSGSTNTTAAPGPPVNGVWPVIAAVGGDFALKCTNYYSFRWVAGNPGPTQIGSWLAQYPAGTYPGTEAIASTTRGYAPEPKRQRLTESLTRSGYNANPISLLRWGPWLDSDGGAPINQMYPVHLNPAIDVSGDEWVPNVHSI